MRLAPVGAAILAVALYLSAFQIRENEQAIVVQLGEPKRTIAEPGLHFKVPFIQNLEKFEKRLLPYDASPREVLSLDKKNLVIDNYAIWQIVDPLKFFQTLRNVQRAQSRLDDIIYSELRETLGRHELIEIIGEKREALMDSVTKKANAQAASFGIAIRDVRIMGADLPEENSKAVYQRMNAEREREAKRYRSEGEEEAVKITSSADRDKTVILAEAYKKSQELRGEGEALAARVYAEGFSEDVEFFQFQRRMEAYQHTLGDKSTIIMGPEDDFLRYLGNSTGARAR
ncbi:MAG: protease modulator HflC [Candidatus Methylomirabilis sp.]|nr:protease modulator HflC [Deltaproteobacteria bacterium]